MRALLASSISVCLLLAATSCDLFKGKDAAPAAKEPTPAAAAETAAKEAAAPAAAEAGWIDLFDGKSLEGWKVNENPESFSVKDGAIVANGNRAHLFYMGATEPFVDFELEAVIMTKPGSNSGVYIHTQYQDSGWPKYGYEVQVNNSQSDPQRTGGLYATEGAQVMNVAPAKDDVWFTMNVKVQGKTVQVKVDGKTVVDYTEPPGKQPGADYTRVVDKGTFALQAHDPGSTVMYKSLRVRRLP